MKKKCYIYTRVSSAKQVEGYSLEAQVQRLEDYAAYRGLEIVGKYCDAGFSGKSIAGRPDFMRMFNDILSEKDDISFVLVFKLSRFGRNAADVLKSMQVLTDNGIDLVSVDDSIDSSTAGGKFTLTILSAVAEIERENITAQFAAGRRQGVKNGNWKGGPIPYGYKKNGKKNVPDENEAPIVKMVFDLYVNSDYSILQITKYLNENGYTKQTRKGNVAFTHTSVSNILKSEYYCGRVIYGKDNKEYQKTKDENLLIITKGVHEPLISEELFDAAAAKREDVLKKKREQDASYGWNDEISVLGGLIKCPVCGSGLTSRVRRLKNQNHGGYYPTDRFYICGKHRNDKGKVCPYSRQIKQEKLDAAVFELLDGITSSTEFVHMVEERLGKSDDLSRLEKENREAEKERDLLIAKIERLGAELDDLDVTEEDYDSIYASGTEKIDDLYDELDVVEAECNKLEKLLSSTSLGVKEASDIRELLDNFGFVVKQMNNEEKRVYCRTFIDRIDLFEEKQNDGRLVKSITFKFMVGKNKQENLFTVECTNTPITTAEAKATYPQIKQFILDKHNVKVTSLYIGQIKSRYGLEKRKNYNLSKDPDAYVPKCPRQKEEYIVEALKHFKMLDEDVKLID